jgi:anti-sigma factor RsiW
MTNHEHERATDLIARRGVDDIAAADVSWLESHLSQCHECADFAEEFEQTGNFLRSLAVTAGPALVTSTQARVRARAEQLREQQARMVLVTVSFCIGVLFSTASAWLWWKLGGWVVQQLGLPESIVGPGVLLFWLLPAIVIAVLMVVVPHTVLSHPLLLSLTGEHEGEIR